MFQGPYINKKEDLLSIEDKFADIKQCFQSIPFPKADGNTSGTKPFKQKQGKTNQETNKSKTNTDKTSSITGIINSSKSVQKRLSTLQPSKSLNKYAKKNFSAKDKHGSSPLANIRSQTSNPLHHTQKTTTVKQVQSPAGRKKTMTTSNYTTPVSKIQSEKSKPSVQKIRVKSSQQNIMNHPPIEQRKNKSPNPSTSVEIAKTSPVIKKQTQTIQKKAQGTKKKSVASSKAILLTQVPKKACPLSPLLNQKVKKNQSSSASKKTPEMNKIKTIQKKCPEKPRFNPSATVPRKSAAINVSMPIQKKATVTHAPTSATQKIRKVTNNITLKKSTAKAIPTPPIKRKNVKQMSSNATVMLEKSPMQHNQKLSAQISSKPSQIKSSLKASSSTALLKKEKLSLFEQKQDRRSSFQQVFDYYDKFV